MDSNYKLYIKNNDEKFVEFTENMAWNIIQNQNDYIEFLRKKALNIYNCINNPKKIENVGDYKMLKTGVITYINKELKDILNNNMQKEDNNETNDN